MDKIIENHLVMYILDPDAAVSLSIRSEIKEDEKYELELENFRRKIDDRIYFIVSMKQITDNMVYEGIIKI